VVLAAVRVRRDDAVGSTFSGQRRSSMPWYFERIGKKGYAALKQGGVDDRRLESDWHGESCRMRQNTAFFFHSVSELALS
jgi:hypothetical protein